MKNIRIVLALAIAALGIYAAGADDKPGAAVIGMLLMVAGVVVGVRAARNRLPVAVARTALTAGVVVAAIAALLIHRAVVTGPLFPQSQEVPSIAASAPPSQYATAIERARMLARAAILEQNLPGVSVAVGVPLPSAPLANEGTVVWAEGFGWRDVVTRTPVTPNTRFNIGTAAPAVTVAVASLKLTNSAADEAKAWSPEAIGEAGEDFPPLTLLRHIILQPLGVMPLEYPLPGDRATFYVPRSDGNPLSGQRLMYMRDLACCANKMAFYSTPSDLVRFALAKNPGSVNGELAGGLVMSVSHRADGVVIAVTSNMAHANTSSLAQRIGDAFAEQAR